MNTTNWVEFAVAVLTGLATCIPLAVKLAEYVNKAVKEKNWNNLLNLTMDFMEEAERKFEDGATRKEWVLAMIQASSGSINYEIDIEAVGNLIDKLCNMSKVVNAPQSDEKEAG